MALRPNEPALSRALAENPNKDHEPQGRLLLVLIMLTTASPDGRARTVWRCLRDGTVEPRDGAGAGLEMRGEHARRQRRGAAESLGRARRVQGHALSARAGRQDRLLDAQPAGLDAECEKFTVATPPSSSAHLGLGHAGKPEVNVYKREFKSAAQATGIDEAWLRAIAHAESDYAADAVSVKGAKGVMQLMPETIGDYGVKDPFSAKQSIMAGAKLLKTLEDQYGGDRVLAAAAYNAGAGAVAQYGGVPPYVETQEYVAKVTTLYARYRQALGLPPRSVDLQPAQ